MSLLWQLSAFVSSGFHLRSEKKPFFSLFILSMLCVDVMPLLVYLDHRHQYYCLSLFCIYISLNMYIGIGVFDFGSITILLSIHRATIFYRMLNTLTESLLVFTWAFLFDTLPASTSVTANSTIADTHSYVADGKEKYGRYLFKWNKGKMDKEHKT